MLTFAKKFITDCEFCQDDCSLCFLRVVFTEIKYMIT